MRKNVIVVDSNDHIIGGKDKADINYETDRIRLSKLWVEDEAGNVLIQKRGDGPDFNPGLFVFAMCGLNHEGDTYEWTARRKARNELGIYFKHLRPLAIMPLADPLKQGFVGYFTVVAPGVRPETKCDPEEVAEARWFGKDELRELMKMKPKLFVEDLLKIPLRFKLL